MRQGVLELRAFYATPLGAAARRMIGRKLLEAWGDLASQDVLALGYATPFVEPGRSRRMIAAMPASQGVELWPAGAPNAACLVDEAALPFANALFDRILAVHALGESDSPAALLREAGRVLAPSGRLIVAVTARRGPWTYSDATPFGQGRPFSRAQLVGLLREADLEPMGWTRALYAPPLASAHRWADPLEQIGARLWPGFAGVILMEAAKQSRALIPKGARSRLRAFPVLQPAPAARLGS
jgi:SAM-dependent methyltransferase